MATDQKYLNSCLKSSPMAGQIVILKTKMSLYVMFITACSYVNQVVELKVTGLLYGLKG